MPPQEVARQWFISGQGIDRHVISMDIQRYLGNDATVRPGRNEGVDGYWIKAYRNLTSAMISDLRSDSARWSHEQDQTGVRGSSSPASYTTSGTTEPPDTYIDYADSRTFQQGNANATSRRNAESPVVDGPYGVPANPRTSGRGGVDAMQIDAPPQQDSRGRYNQPTGQQTRGGYPPDNGQNPSNRGGYMDSRGPSYQQPDSLMTDAYGRVSVAQPYQDPRFAGRQPPMVDGAPPGMVRQGDYYVPVTSGYGQPGVMAPARPDTQQYPPGPYGQQVEPQRDPRSTRDPRDPRYGGVQPDFNDTSRYNYPSPATTVASVGSRDTISSPPGPSPYGNMQPQYDQYGRPVAQQQPQPSAAGYGAQDPGYLPQTRGDPRGDPNYGRGQPAPSGRNPAAPVSGSNQDRDARRRRLH